MKKWIVILCLICAIAPISAQDDALICEDGFRLIEHAIGETCVSVQPQRIIPLDLVIFDLMLNMDIKPVALPYMVMETYLDMHPYLAPVVEALQAEKVVDTGFPPNIETVMSVKPDLIISPRDFFSEMLYPSLSDVAPTVLFEPAPGDWQKRLRFAGDVFNESELVETLIEVYEARIEALQAVLPEDAHTLKISLVRVLPGQIGFLISGSSGDAVLQSVGLGRPDSQTYDYETVMTEFNGWPEIKISAEEMALLDGDIIFVFGEPSEIVDNPLWQALPAVQNGKVYEVGYYWWGDSLLSAHAMLDDLFIYIAETEPTLPNPFIPDVEVDIETTDTTN